jgi:hypothetical protein
MKRGKTSLHKTRTGSNMNYISSFEASAQVNIGIKIQKNDVNCIGIKIQQQHNN